MSAESGFPASLNLPIIDCVVEPRGLSSPRLETHGRPYLNVMPAVGALAGADEAPMSDRARDVWVEHLVTSYMETSQPDWNHMCAVPNGLARVHSQRTGCERQATALVHIPNCLFLY